MNTTFMQNHEQVILKGYVYRNSRGQYLTLMTMVPKFEYKPSITIPDGRHSPTSGVFIDVIGNAGVLRPWGRLYLSTYQKYLENEGYRFLATVPFSKGADYVYVRKMAYKIIAKDMKTLQDQ